MIITIKSGLANNEIIKKVKQNPNSVIITL